jgi:glycosyltransferase involved in cell wall biosynthesis
VKHNGQGPSRVLFIVPTLTGAGTERVALHLVQYLDRQAFDARLGVLEPTGLFLKTIDPGLVLTPRIGKGWVHYPSPATVPAVLRGIVMAPLQQLDLLYQFRPHILVSLVKGMNIAARFAVSLYGRKQIKWIAREGSNTPAMIQWERMTATARALERRIVGSVYRAADRVIASSQGLAAGLAREIHVPMTKMVAIPNGVEIDEIRRRAEEPVQVPDRFVVAAGRLEHQKGFDLLLPAFAQGAAQRDVSLVILGEGPDRAALERLSLSLGIRDRVLMPGAVLNPWSYITRAEAFVLSSRWEGFGNVIIEAMACGTPVIVTDCDYGPTEIVEAGRTGLIVPTGDPIALGAAIRRLIDDRAEATRLAAAASTHVESFRIQRTIVRYEHVFDELLDEASWSAS